MKPTIKTIRVGDLVRDEDLWPRYLTKIDDTNLARIRDAIRAGEHLPPPRADRQTLIIIDGNHRVAANKGLFGEDHAIEVELADYSSKKDMLLDAARLNSRHGHQLDSKDRIRTTLRLRELGASVHDICSAMAMTKEQYEKFQMRTAIGSNGKPVALPMGAQHLADQHYPLTMAQEKLISGIGGASVIRQARMLMCQIRARATDLENENEVAVLVELRDLLISVLSFSK